MSVFPLTILTMQETAHEGEVTSVTAPTADGEITILARHTPLVTVLKPGRLVLRKPFEGNVHDDPEEVRMAVGGGFLEVRKSGEVVVLADMAERAGDIDLEQARAARARAEKMLEEEEKLEAEDFARFQAILDREMARIKVAQNTRK